jgi:site-specific recombinase XerD
MLNPFYLSAALGLLGIAITNGQNCIWCLNVRFFPFREVRPRRANCSVRFARFPHLSARPLERSEIKSLFLQIDCQTLLGQRDDALLRLLYNTEMRAQELGDLDAKHLRFSRPYSGVETPG